MTLGNGLTTVEAVTLAQQLVNREKTKTELINDGFNRYSLNSKDDLPTWFLEDEAKHYKSNLPVTKEAMAALRARLRALDARPIKKVAEAKARKKYKAVQKLQKAMKKAEGVNESTDMTEREKASQIQKLMRKGSSTAKGKKGKPEVKVVVAKGAHRGLKGRPKGVKGRYRMVDARMRKEVCHDYSCCCSYDADHAFLRCERKSERTRQIRSVEAGLCSFSRDSLHNFPLSFCMSLVYSSFSLGRCCLECPLYEFIFANHRAPTRLLVDQTANRIAIFQKSLPSIRRRRINARNLEVCEESE